MAKQKKLPKQIYVYWESTSDGPYLSAQETPRGIENGAQVGVYVLDQVKEMKITEKLV